jgi:transcriptional regulator with XRE-family HTH domain
MARAALGWGVRELAKRAGMDKATVVRFEAGESVRVDTSERIEATLVAEGIEFKKGDWVRAPAPGVPRRARGEKLAAPRRRRTRANRP